MNEIIAKWFSKEKGCMDQNDIMVTFGSLTVKSFKGLFLIASVSLCFALIIFISNFLYENKTILVSNCSIRQKVTMMVKSFDKQKDGSSDGCKTTFAEDEGMAISTLATTPVQCDCPQSPATNIFHNVEDIVSPRYEGCFTTAPNTPINDNISIVTSFF